MYVEDYSKLTAHAELINLVGKYTVVRCGLSISQKNCHTSLSYQ